MRKIMYSIMIVFCITFAGCVSKSEYLELERRVTQLEEHLAETENKKEPVGNASDNNYASELIQGGNKEFEETYTYYIDNLSDQDVVNECKYYFENVPIKGQSYEDYYSKMRATPISTYESTCLFYDRNVRDSKNERDAIMAITIEGSQTEMDGSIGYYGNYCGVRVTLVIHDYSRAANIYDLLYDEVLIDDFSGTYDLRESTQWMAGATYNYSETSGVGVIFMTMDKLDSGFQITATYYSRL